MTDLQQVGRPAGIGRIPVAQLEPEIVDHRQCAEPGGVAGRAKISVDVVLGEPGIDERALGAFGMQLKQRLVVGLARRMLEDSDDIGLAFYAHRGLLLPFLRRNARSADGILFGALGQSRIAAMPHARPSAPLRMCAKYQTWRGSRLAVIATDRLRREHTCGALRTRYGRSKLALTSTLTSADAWLSCLAPVLPT